MCQGHPDGGMFTIRKQSLDHEASLPPDHCLLGESTDAFPQERTLHRTGKADHPPALPQRGPEPQFNTMGLLLLKPSYENSTDRSNVTVKYLDRLRSRCC